MEWPSARVQRGSIIMQRPTGIVSMNRGDHIRRRSGEKIIAQMRRKKTGHRRMVGLSDELKGKT